MQYTFISTLCQNERIRYVKAVKDSAVLTPILLCFLIELYETSL